MKAKTKVFLIIFFLIISNFYPIQSFNKLSDVSSKNIKDPSTIQKRTVYPKIESSNNYKLDSYPEKSDYSLNENIIIVVFLYNPQTMIQISDNVLIATSLGTKSIQLSSFTNIITLDKGDFLDGLNSITVSYKDQSVTFQILRQDPIRTGSTVSKIQINDILNANPAPGVPEYINFSLINPTYFNFPTEQNEYFHVAINYGITPLILATTFYQLNKFIIFNQINFTIPLFLQKQEYNLTLYYSGDPLLQSSQQNVNVSIHDFTPSITTTLSNTVIGSSNVLNQTNTFIYVSIQGFLPPFLQVTVFLSNGLVSYTLLHQNVTGYRQVLPIAIINTISTGLYQLQVNFTYITGPNVITFNYSVNVVNKIELIIRTNTTIFTLGNPVLFDFLCYDPITFNAVSCLITMSEGSTKIMTLQAVGGHVQKVMIFNSLDTSIIHIYTFQVLPSQNISLYANNVDFYAKFYHNTSINVVFQKNIIDKTELVSFEADTVGTFSIINNENLILNSFDYNQAGSYTNYYVDFNNTFRGINTITVNFYPLQSNFAIVFQKFDIFVYDKIIIQSVQTNASFYQLGSSMLFNGIATIGSSTDSLNGVQVSLLLNNEIIANTTIETNDFTFIVKTPDKTGLMKYQIAIYADNLKFIIASDVYEITVSVINNFGLNFIPKDYQVGDTIKLDIFGLENRNYKLFYTLNGSSNVLDDFVYNHTFSYYFPTKMYGHYLVYLEELVTKDLSYYAINVLQNPTIQVQYDLLHTFTNNSLQLQIDNYIGTFQIKIDNLYQNYISYSINNTGIVDLTIYSSRPGNHSVTILLNNNYTLNKVRIYYFLIYQKIQLSSFTYTSTTSLISEEDTISIHLQFKEFTNQSINDIPIQIVTNENTILSQANIFNSESDFQFTVLGNNLSLVINDVNNQFVHNEIIPLNITVFKLLTSNLQDNYSYNTATNLNIHFAYKYYPINNSFAIQYQLLKNSAFMNSIKTIGQDLSISFNDNGNYNLVIQVSCYLCMNRTFQANILVKKFFDLSNTNLTTALCIIGSIPLAIVGISIFKKKKSIL